MTAQTKSMKGFILLSLNLKIYFGDSIWHQLLQPKYVVQTNYIYFPHSLQLIQATVETLCKSLRIATFGCNTKWKSL